MRLCPAGPRALREVAGGYSLEVKPGDQLVDRFAATQIRRQDAGREENTIFGRRGVVTNPRLLHLQDTGSGEQFSGGEITIADDQSLAVLVASIGMVGHEVVDFRLNGRLEHLTGTSRMISSSVLRASKASRNSTTSGSIGWPTRGAAGILAVAVVPCRMAYPCALVGPLMTSNMIKSPAGYAAFLQPSRTQDSTISHKADHQELRRPEIRVRQ